MSKIIKPGDGDIYNSARKFESGSLLGSKPAKSGINSADSSPAAPDAASLPGPAVKLKSKETVEEPERGPAQIMSEAEKHATGGVRKRAQEEVLAEGPAGDWEQANVECGAQAPASSRITESVAAQLRAQEKRLVSLFASHVSTLATEIARKIINGEIEKDSSLVLSQAEESIRGVLDREGPAGPADPAPRGDQPEGG